MNRREQVKRAIKMQGPLQMTNTMNSNHNNAAMECDFLVCGGGIGGISAAIQAGRLGLRTILLEKEWCLGGNGGPLLGVHWAGVKGEQPGWNETGIVEELTLRLHARNAFINGVMFNTHPSMEEAFDEVLRGAGVTVLRRHCLLSAETEPASAGRRRISRVRILNIENLEQRDILIHGFALDSSGDAVLAALAGAETVMGRESKAQTGERSAGETPDATVAASSITALVVDT
ncbi:MAG: FAD-dependent oxidoreductase, partial [Spartobacteria bacterium]